jgi:molybdate transport system ATP-binding protein
MLDVRITNKRSFCTIDIDFQCAGGKLTALTGPSGAGKTTIIRALAGLEKPDSGRISFGETSWFNSADKTWVPARARKVGYVFQEHTLFPHLNIEKNVGFSCRDRSRVHELLEILGIRHLAEMMAHQVSGGERQRAALAQALASDPQVLLLDEPFSALDTITRIRLREELKRLKNQLNIPVILVTHDLEEADCLADNIINLPYPKAAMRDLRENESVRQHCLFRHWQYDA